MKAAPADPADKDWDKRLAAFLKTQGITPRQPAPFRQAFLHRSYVNETAKSEAPHIQSNEKLEFLGDSILGLAVAEYLWRRDPSMTEGQLSKKRASLVSEKALAAWARELGLGGLMLLGKGEARSGGADKDALLADCLEAFLAAFYLDQGMEGLKLWMEPQLDRVGTSLNSPDSFENRDFKSQLQEWIQERHEYTPQYRVLKSSGPEHSKVFEVEVLLKGKRLATGMGSSRKEAEQEAAATGLKKLTAG